MRAHCWASRAFKIIDNLLDQLGRKADVGLALEQRKAGVLAGMVVHHHVTLHLGMLCQPFADQGAAFPVFVIVQRIDEIEPAAPRNLDGFRIAAPGRCQHDLSAGAIDEVVQQRDQIRPGPHQTASSIGLVRAIEDAVYVEENHPHAAVLSLTKCVLAGIGGSPRNVEVGSATFVHQQDAPADEHKEHRAEDRYFHHASEGSSDFNRSHPAVMRDNCEAANPGTIGNREALAARRWSHEQHQPTR